MRSILTKIPAMIGLLLNLGGIGFIIRLQNGIQDKGLGIFILTLAFLTFGTSTILYLADAVLSIIKAFMKVDTVFNSILAGVIILPLVIICLYPWLFAILLWYCAVSVLETVSIIKHIPFKRKKLFNKK